MGDCLWAGKLSHYVTNQPGQLSLAILRPVLLYNEGVADS